MMDDAKEQAAREFWARFERDNEARTAGPIAHRNDLRAALIAAHVSEVRAPYSGSGDDGQFEEAKMEFVGSDLPTIKVLSFEREMEKAVRGQDEERQAEMGAIPSQGDRPIDRCPTRHAQRLFAAALCRLGEQ
jgi:hypothetical protein